MARYESVVDLVGGTPLVRLHRVAAGLRPRIYVKLEAANPGGSSKDRTALWMIRAAERSGELAPGGTVVEATTGNTGIGLALIAAHLGYRSVIFMPASAPEEKVAQLTAYGTEVRLVDKLVSATRPVSLRAVARRFVAQTPGAWFANQCDNPANPLAHYATTGPEIWRDTEGAVTHLVSPLGTGATISGTGRFLKEANPAITVVGADLPTSCYTGGDGSPDYIEGVGHAVPPGTAQDVWPGSLDTSTIDRYLAIPAAEAIATAQAVGRADGLLLGGSAGLAIAAALRLAVELTDDHLIVAIVPDSGRSYLTTYYDDGWLTRLGFRTGPPDARHAGAAPTVRDLLARSPQADHPVLLDHAATVEQAIRCLRTRHAAIGGPDRDGGQSGSRQPGSLHTGSPAKGDPATVPDDWPLLVGPARHRAGPLHPAEVTGWTTLAALRTAAETGSERTVGELARPALARAGIDEPAEVAAARLGALPLPAALLVLVNGRVTAVLDDAAATRRAITGQAAGVSQA